MTIKSWMYETDDNVNVYIQFGDEDKIKGKPDDLGTLPETKVSCALYGGVIRIIGLHFPKKLTEQYQKDSPYVKMFDDNEDVEKV